MSKLELTLQALSRVARGLLLLAVVSILYSTYFACPYMRLHVYLYQYQYLYLYLYLHPYPQS